MTTTRPAARCASLGIALIVAACARPQGDLGYYPPSFLHDEAMPVIGKMLASARGEPVSNFPLTDNERVLQNRAEALIAPPDTRDWMTGTLVELQRTRITPVSDTTFDPTMYARLLLSTRYASSTARYQRLTDDMAQDRALIAPFFAAAIKVRKDDRARFATLKAVSHVGAIELTEAYGRMEENSRTIAWGWRALRFRLAAYANALDRLEIATPDSERASAAYAAWQALKAAFDAANIGTALGSLDGLPPPPPGVEFDRPDS